MKKIFLLLVLSLNILANTIFAMPKEIIIVRHADRLNQKHPGTTLSPKGVVRSIHLAFYIIKKFGMPDYIFGGNPKNFKGKDSSLRELQTLGPLENMMASQRPNEGFFIQHSYASSEYTQLAHELLSNPQYNHKVILICWAHKLINDLATQLGVKQSLPEWQVNNYDRVYILKYNNKGEITQFMILNNQYPVKFEGSWQDLSKKIS